MACVAVHDVHSIGHALEIVPCKAMHCGEQAMNVVDLPHSSPETRLSKHHFFLITFKPPGA
jgi:hypothetical protein